LLKNNLQKMKNINRYYYFVVLNKYVLLVNTGAIISQ